MTERKTPSEIHAESSRKLSMILKRIRELQTDDRTLTWADAERRANKEVGEILFAEKHPDRVGKHLIPLHKGKPVDMSSDGGFESRTIKVSQAVYDYIESVRKKTGETFNQLISRVLLASRGAK